MSGHVLLLAQSDPCLAFCSPDGPGTPFAGPYLTAIDVLRIAVVLAGVGSIVLTPKVMTTCRTWGQRSRWASLAVFTLVAMNTETEHLGDWPSPRLMLNLLAAVLALIGLWSFYRREHGTTGSVDSGPPRSGP